MLYAITHIYLPGALRLTIFLGELGNSSGNCVLFHSMPPMPSMDASRNALGQKSRL